MARYFCSEQERLDNFNSLLPDCLKVELVMCPSIAITKFVRTRASKMQTCRAGLRPQESQFRQWRALAQLYAHIRLQQEVAHCCRPSSKPCALREGSPLPTLLGAWTPQLRNCRRSFSASATTTQPVCSHSHTIRASRAFQSSGVRTRQRVLLRAWSIVCVSHGRDASSLAPVLF